MYHGETDLIYSFDSVPYVCSAVGMISSHLFFNTDVLYTSPDAQLNFRMPSCLL